MNKITDYNYSILHDFRFKRAKPSQEQEQEVLKTFFI